MKKILLVEAHTGQYVALRSGVRTMKAEQFDMTIVPGIGVKVVPLSRVKAVVQGKKKLVANIIPFSNIANILFEDEEDDGSGREVVADGASEDKSKVAGKNKSSK